MIARRSLLLVLLATLAACAKNGNNGSLEMYGVCSVPDSCSFSGKCDKFLLGNYAVDLAMTRRLMVPMEVHNQLVNNADTGAGTSGHTNTNDATVERVIVSWSAPGISSVAGVTSNVAQVVPASGTSVVGLELLDDAAAADLAAAPAAGVTAIADVKLKGQLNDGSEFETGTYRLPVHVCNGCLAANYTCSDPTQIPSSPCLYWGEWPNTFKCGALAVTYSIGGSVTGQTTNLILTCNSVEIPIGASDTTWIFPYGLANAANYNCAVTTPATGCAVDNAAGTIAGANVTNVNVHCP